MPAVVLAATGSIAALGGLCLGSKRVSSLSSPRQAAAKANNESVVKLRVQRSDMRFTFLVDGQPDFVLPLGNSDGTYDTAIGFENTPAKYIRFSPQGGYGVGNYGSDWGYKLREMRFYYAVPLWSDLNSSRIVNLVDLAIIAEDWQKDNWTTDPIPYCPGKPQGDANGDCRVDLTDIMILANEWLESVTE